MKLETSGTLTVAKADSGSSPCEPRPGDDSQLLAHIEFQIRPLSHHFGGDLDPRIQTANALLGLAAGRCEAGKARKGDTCALMISALDVSDGFEVGQRPAMKLPARPRR